MYAKCKVMKPLLSPTLLGTVPNDVLLKLDGESLIKYVVICHVLKYRNCNH